MLRGDSYAWSRSGWAPSQADAPPRRAPTGSAQGLRLPIQLLLFHFRWPLLFATVLLGYLGAFVPALAQTVDDILKREIADPHTITVLSRPKVPWQGRGGPRYTVEVVTTADGRPVNDATVIVTMDRPDGSKAGQVTLDRNLAVPGIYEGRISVLQAGVWNWGVAVSTPRGDAMVEGTQTVVPGPSAGLRGEIGWWGMLLALAVIIGLARRSLRPPKKAQQIP